METGIILKKKFFRLAYEYYERWFPCPSSGRSWEACAIDGARICAENGNDKFLVDLMKAVYMELSRNKEGNHEPETNNAGDAA